jgi:signal transduction histidine kinase
MGAQNTGIGLLGLAERVTALGGTVDAVPTTQGFRITVDVPHLADHTVEARIR